MTSEPLSPGRAAGFAAEAALIFAGWSLVGLLFGTSTYLRAAAYGEPITVSHAVALTALDVYSWAVVTVVAFAMTHRFPLEASAWARRALLHVGAGTGLVTARALAVHVVFSSFEPRLQGTVGQALFTVPFYLVSYLMLLGAAHAVEYARRFRARELSASQLETQLARAQLQMLKMQLHPHFLFNTLHAISTLVHRDPDMAERMIASLSDLLRSTLTHQQAQEVTVAEEMDLLEPYLDIEKTRLGDRLAIRAQVEPGAQTALLPHLILQPLVENAIRHGISPRRRGGTVEISVGASGDRLRVRVRDDGRGFSGAAEALRPGGLGLSNTRARLRQLYGAAHRFEIVSTPEEGTRVEILLPLRTAGAPPAPVPAR